jgi:hypothetical protein
MILYYSSRSEDRREGHFKLLSVYVESSKKVQIIKYSLMNEDTEIRKSVTDVRRYSTV